jgi:hypothetical protein
MATADAKLTAPTAPQSSPNTTSDAAHKPSPSINTSDSARPHEAISPPFSPNSTTPVLSKDDDGADDDAHDEPELDFVGRVDVNDNLPSEKELATAGDLLVLDSKGQSRPFKELYQGEGVAPRQLIIFIRHFFCGVCLSYSSSASPQANTW